MVNGSNGWNRQAAFSLFSMLGYDKKTIIELACGNGWYYRELYFWQNDLTYYGYDLNEYAINDAKQKLKYKENKINRKSDATFEVKDILNDDIYKNDATHVFFYAAMSMFTKDDRLKLLKNIHKCLENNHGIFCGNSGIELAGKQQWDKFIGLSKDEDEIYDELKMFFKNVFIMPRKKDDETVLFMASDGELPFYNGSDSDVICVYESSYQFQGYLAQAKNELLLTCATHYFIISDDLILYPNINELNYRDELCLGEHDSMICGATNIFEVGWTLSSVIDVIDVFSTQKHTNYKDEIYSLELAKELLSSKYSLDNKITIKKLMNMSGKKGLIKNYSFFDILKLLKLKEVPYPVFVGDSD